MGFFFLFLSILNVRKNRVNNWLSYWNTGKRLFLTYSQRELSREEDFNLKLKKIAAEKGYDEAAILYFCEMKLEKVIYHQI